MLTMYVVHTDRDLTDLTSVPDRRAGFLTGSFSTPCILSQGVTPQTSLSVISAIVLSKNKKMLCNSVIYLMVIPLSSEINTSVNQYIP